MVGVDKVRQFQVTSREPKPVIGRYIVWKDGIPYPAYGDPFTKEALETIITTSLALEYEVEQEEDEDLGIMVTKADELQYKGMTNLEVGGRRMAKEFARGNVEMQKYVFDRVVGKPTARIETNGTIELKLQDHLRVFREEDRQLQEQQLKAIEDKQSIVDAHVIQTKRTVNMEDM